MRCRRAARGASMQSMQERALRLPEFSSYLLLHTGMRAEKSHPKGLLASVSTQAQLRNGDVVSLHCSPRTHFGRTLPPGPTHFSPNGCLGAVLAANRASSGSATQPNRGNPMCVGSCGAATCEAVIPTTPPADASGLPEPASDMFRGGAARLGRLAHHPHRFMLCSSPMYVGCVLNLSKSAAPCPPSSAI